MSTNHDDSSTVKVFMGKNQISHHMYMSSSLWKCFIIQLIFLVQVLSSSPRARTIIGSLRPKSNAWHHPVTHNHVYHMLSFRVNNHISLVKYLDKWSKCAFQSTPKITRRRRAMTIFFSLSAVVCLFELKQSSSSSYLGPLSTHLFNSLFLLLPSLNSLSISLRSSSKAERKWQIHSRDLKWKFNEFVCRKLTKLNGRKSKVALSMDSSSPRRDSV